MTDIDSMLADARKQADRLASWRRAVKDHVFVGDPKDEADLVAMLGVSERTMRAMAGEIGRLTAKLEIARQLIDVLHVRDDSCVVPCVDHPVLDVIAKAIEPEFPFGRGGEVEGPAECVTRESECVEFRDATNGQRFEIVVRPIYEGGSEP